MSYGPVMRTPFSTSPTTHPPDPEPYHMIPNADGSILAHNPTPPLAASIRNQPMYAPDTMMLQHRHMAPQSKMHASSDPHPSSGVGAGTGLLLGGGLIAVALVALVAMNK